MATGKVTITSEEYRDLVIACYDNCNLTDDKNCLRKQVDKLEEEVHMLKDLYLEKIVDHWELEYHDLSKLIGLTKFPFKYEELKEAGITVEEALEWIEHKKKEMDAEKASNPDSGE